MFYSFPVGLVSRSQILNEGCGVLIGQVIALSEAHRAVPGPGWLEVRLSEDLLLVVVHVDVPHLKYLLRRCVRHLFADGVLGDPVLARFFRRRLSLSELVEGLLDVCSLCQALVLCDRGVELLDEFLKRGLGGGLGRSLGRCRGLLRTRGRFLLR